MALHARLAWRFVVSRWGVGGRPVKLLVAMTHRRRNRLRFGGRNRLRIAVRSCSKHIGGNTETPDALYT